MRPVLAVLAMTFVAPVAAQPSPAPDTATEEAPADQALAQSCSAHKFETRVQFTAPNGERRQSNVRMCGTLGQTDAQWANTLRDAAKKIRTNDSMPEEARQQVIAAITAEVAKLDAGSGPIAPAMSFTLPQGPSSEAPASGGGGLQGYSSFPPLPPPVAPPASKQAGSTSPSPGTTVPATARPSGTTTILPAVAPPRLTILCGLTTDYRDPGPCSTLEANSTVQVRADEDLPAGLQLRFVRKGAIRGSISLAAMRQGQTVTFRTPSKLCAGVLRTTAQIEIVKAGAGPSGAVQLLDKRGPYDLRC